jgi:hypothetical protein
MAMPINSARLPARLPRRADTPIVDADTLGTQASGLLRFVVNEQLARRRDHPPPRKTCATPTPQKRANCSSSAGIPGFRRHFAIGDEVTRIKGIKDTRSSPFEVGPG